MYRRPKFLEILLSIREEMAREADYDIDLFAEMVRSGSVNRGKKVHRMTDAPVDDKKARPKKTVRPKARVTAK